MVQVRVLMGMGTGYSGKPQGSPWQSLPAGGIRGYVRMAVMDGKSIGHHVSEKMNHDVVLLRMKA
jgi:hypothetical protein